MSQPALQFIGHYLVGWAIPSVPSFVIGVVLSAVGLMTAKKKRT